MNSRQENGSKLSFTARILTKYSWERFFLFAVRNCLKPGFLKFCKLTSNLMILGQIIASNRTNVHKLNSRINYARLHYIRYKKQTYLRLTIQDAAPGSYQVRPEPLQTFQPSYASSKMKNENDAIPNGISDFHKRRISQPKTH